MERSEQNTGAFEKFHPIETKRASEAIYEQVKDLIIKGELKPGARLPSERNMMELFRRSRPTIREALRMLERSGYIRTVAGSNGAVVMEPNDKNMEQSMEDALQVGHISLAEMSEYRKASEVAAAGWAAERRSEEDLAAMAELLEKMGACVEDYEAFIDMDPQFHGLLAVAAKNTVSVVMNRILSRINRNFMKETMRSMPLEEQIPMNRRVHEMHQAIFEAVRAGDSRRACQAMDAHLSAFESDLKKK